MTRLVIVHELANNGHKLLEENVYDVLTHPSHSSEVLLMVTESKLWKLWQAKSEAVVNGSLRQEEGKVGGTVGGKAINILQHGRIR